MGIFDIFRRQIVAAPPAIVNLNSPGAPMAGSTEIGQRATPEQAMQRILRQMWVDPSLRARILDIRRMDYLDGRVKKIHLRTSRAAAKGGIKLVASGAPKWLINAFDDYERRLHLNRREKLESDIRGLMMEGNLPMQWVLNDDRTRVVNCVRMPAETIRANVGAAGIFDEPANAYEQWDLVLGRPIASFGLWQMTMGRLSPDNYDDFGSPGRPYLDATRTVWQQLKMAEEDLVIRRRMRAPLRMAHVLEGASEPEMKAYRLSVETDQAAGNFRDYFMSKKGAVTAVQGDANLDQIGDMAYLLDNFFAGAPAPRGLFGYTKDIARDILADLKEDFFDELDALQDNVSWLYEEGFILELLLRGKISDNYDFKVQFSERRTDTPNQRADLALKLQALGLPKRTVWEASGVDVHDAEIEAEKQAKEQGPYRGDPSTEGPTVPGETPAPTPTPRPRVSVTPGNGRMGESDTSISTTRPTR